MESGKSTRAIIPGITMMKIGKIFRKPAKMEPALACTLVFAPITRWTMTYSFTNDYFNLDAPLYL